MPKPGLSLVGFLTDAAQAVDYLRHTCVPPPGRESEDALLEEWHAARARIGPPFPNAGDAAPQPVPDALRPYLDEPEKQPWVAERLRDLEGASFQVVAIDPLISHQLAIVNTRVAEHREGLSGPTVADLLETCLPMTEPSVEYDASPVRAESSSVVIKSPRRDLRLGRFGIFGARSRPVLAGARLYLALPFVHVVRIDGRCYLLNGYHRAFGARLAGATHMPCLFRDVPDPETVPFRGVGLPEAGQSFPFDVLESANPPTMAHDTQGRAHAVALRAKARIIHVSWHQYLIDDE